jgi:hypothetical protein
MRWVSFEVLIFAPVIMFLSPFEKEQRFYGFFTPWGFLMGLYKAEFFEHSN